MQPRLLRAAAPAAVFASVFEAGREAGLRVGWLEMPESVVSPGDLEAAAAAGAMRAVAVARGRVVTTKIMTGPPVLRDLVREHFTGCRLLLVRGEIDAPEIRPAKERWRIRWASGVEKELTTDALIEHLRRPSFP